MPNEVSLPQAATNQQGATSKAACRIPLLMLYLFTILLAIIPCFTINSAVISLLQILVAVSAALWVVRDAHERGTPLVSIVQFFVLILWPIAVPLYLVWSRGLKGLGWVIVNLVGLLATTIIAFNLTNYFLYGPEIFSAVP